MNTTTKAARALLGCALLVVATGVQAGTLEEDEAHIAELMRAELAAMPLPSSGETVSVPLSGPAPAPVIAEVVSPAPAPVIAEAVAPGPAPVIAEAIAPAPSPPVDAVDDWLATPEQPEGLPFSELAHLIGHRVLIVTAGERVHRGTVRAADARGVTLQVRRAGGGASYTLQRRQIVRIEAR